MLSILTAKHLEKFKVSLAFSNGEKGVLDFQPLIYQDQRPIFQDLQNNDYFKQFQLQSGTLCRKNELDFAPEFLFFQIFQYNPIYQTQFKTWGYL